MEKKPKESLLATVKTDTLKGFDEDQAPRISDVVGWVCLMCYHLCGCVQRFAEAVGFLNALYEAEQHPTPALPPSQDDAPPQEEPQAQGGEEGEGARTREPSQDVATSVEGPRLSEGPGMVTQEAPLGGVREGACPQSSTGMGYFRASVEGEGEGGSGGYVPLDYVSYDFLASMKRGEEGGSGKGSEVFDALFQIAEALLPSVRG